MRTCHTQAGRGFAPAIYLNPVLRLIAAAYRWRDRRRQMRAAVSLHFLNDHLLRDIGLDKADLMAGSTRRTERKDR